MRSPAEIARDRQPSYAVADTFANGRPPVTSLFSPSPSDAYAPALTRTGASSSPRRISGDLRLRHGQARHRCRWTWDHDGTASRWTTTVDTAGGVASFGRTDNALSGARRSQAGVAWNGILAYSTSFNPAYDGAFGLTLAGTGVNSVALPPEKSRSLEAGAKWDVRRDLFVTAAAFNTRR
jgi:hypothetical protein